MVDERSRNGWFVWFSLLCALILSIAPIPEFLAVGRPLWLPLVIAYWLLMAPLRLGMTRVWLLGLAADLLYGTPLGQYALVLALVAFMVISLQQRLRMFPVWQQSLVLLVVFGLAQLLLLWLDSLSGNRPPSLAFLIPALVSALLWPWVFIVLHFCGRRLGVH
ncbi:rod shape-determining protein MreD [Pseudomonas sp. NW5]|uniref:rod shape-determining protein MreD n=1 Tax=Pseudomonas sp. NW5 TaxID=2934934 RepID=UPI00202256E4|nr:rod shape-determining protein MreD [Pseudomonas sp. NW5]MCL7461466.1 rod shape-determining protein MreD [Pseudomonas sp. NW5]